MDFLEFPSLAALPGLHHAVTTREGGLSRDGFAALNLAFHVGDEAETVRSNRQILARELGFDGEVLVAAQQVHGAGITLVSQEDRGRGATDWESAIRDTDALMTQQRGIPLLILVADCAPILLVDPVQRVLAVVHAGWRGAVSGIAGKAVQRMQSEWGTGPADVLAGIGPCLSIENLEVGEEVAEQVEKVDATAVIGGYLKPHLDLRGLIERDLGRVGVSAANIEVLPNCPKEENQRFFSHRGQNGEAGRFGIVAWWE